AGLWRRVVWCGFGPALRLVAQTGLAVAAATAERQSVSAEQIATLIVAALISALAAWIFYRAGRSLAAAGSQPSFAAPWLALTALTVALGVFLRGYLIPTGAMEDTLLIGDRVWVPRFGALVPARGDIIVFRYPIDIRQTFVKRVIGVPGDRIRIRNKT